MRCHACHSYIPEGLASSSPCPQCGREQASLKSPEVPEDQRAPVTHESQKAPALAQAFAPYFTIKTQLAFSNNDVPTTMASSAGSLAFGPTGFSVVCNNGRHWEKIEYESLSKLQVTGDAVSFYRGAQKMSITLFHPWLPKFLPQPRIKRAKVLFQLLSKVRNGLTPFEIATFQRELE